MKKSSFATAVLGVVLAAPAFAQQMTAQDFVTKAASGGMYEVQSSQFVLDQAEASDDVDAFAQHMVQDHKKANDQLKALAQKQNLTVPADLQPEQQQMMDKLQSAEDPGKTYAEEQLKAHKETVALFQQYAEQGDDPQLQQFAAQTLPTLQEHLEMAQKLPNAQ
jgi:putative membrane protein